MIVMARALGAAGDIHGALDRRHANAGEVNVAARLATKA